MNTSCISPCYVMCPVYNWICTISKKDDVMQIQWNLIVGSSSLCIYMRMGKLMVEGHRFVYVCVLLEI